MLASRWGVEVMLVVRAVRLPRNLPLAGSVAARSVRDDPVNAALLALRVLPEKLKARTVPLLLRALPRAPTAAALLLWDRGRRAEAAERVRASLPGARPAKVRRLTSFAVAVDRPVLAGEALAALPVDDPARPRLGALVAWRQGSLREAAALAEAPSRAHGGQGRRNARVARRLTGELATLAPGWTPPRARGDSTYQPVPRRILHVVTNSLPWSAAGYNVRTHAIAKAQRDAGLDPAVATRLGFPVEQGHPSARAVDVIDEVRYHRLLPFGRAPWPDDAHLAANVEAAAALVEELRPALLHAATKHLNGQVALALRERYGLPVVYEVRGFLEETWLSRHGADAELSDRYRLARDVETDCMLRADLVVTLADVMRSEIVGRGIPAERVIVVPNGVDDQFLGEIPDPSRLRGELGIAPDEVVVGLVSNLVAYEGVGTLLEAVRLLADDGVPVRGLIVGDGPERAALLEQARDLGLSERVIFTGRVPFARVGDYHAAIDVFCVPRDDARVTRLVTPLKPLEAMASGRPVVASRLPALAEIVAEDETGLLATAGDPASWAETLRPLLYDGRRCQRLGQAARTHVQRERTWSSLVRRYLAAYASLGVS
jgi:glycosyltransferase involved in cell wall biosynthesis